jgi:hypothetical protein
MLAGGVWNVGANPRRPGATAARIAVALVIGSAACGGGHAPDYEIHGVGVVVHSSAAFTRSGDFASRVENTVDAALLYWRGGWANLRGKTIHFEGERYVRCGGVQSAIGCYDGDIHVSTQDAGVTFTCVEQTVLVHEVGHAVIGDPDHLDPRWMDFAPLEADLESRNLDLAGPAPPCRIAVSVWKHPPAN